YYCDLHSFPTRRSSDLEVEFARGCPYSCTFCNKTLFRNQFRERHLTEVLKEIDQLIARKVDYVYFIDEIFGVGKQVRVLLQEIRSEEHTSELQSLAYLV